MTRETRSRLADVIAEALTTIPAQLTKPADVALHITLAIDAEASGLRVTKRGAPVCGSLQFDTDHRYRCTLKPGHDGDHVMTIHPMQPFWK